MSNQKRNAAARRRRRAQLLQMQNSLCFWCNCPLTFYTSTFDEMIPKSKGGTQRWGNVVLACAPCNHGRGHSIASPEAMKRAALLAPEPAPLSQHNRAGQE